MNKVFSAAITGLEAELIEVEADLSSGLRFFSIVGLPDKSVEESKAINSVSPPKNRDFKNRLWRFLKNHQKF